MIVGGAGRIQAAWFACLAREDGFPASVGTGDDETARVLVQPPAIIRLTLAVLATAFTTANAAASLTTLGLPAQSPAQSHAIGHERTARRSERLDQRVPATLNA